MQAREMDSPSQNTRNRSRMADSNSEAPRPTAVQPASRKSPKARTATAVDREIAQAVVTCTGVLWLVAIFVGLITHTGNFLNIFKVRATILQAARPPVLELLVLAQPSCYRADLPTDTLQRVKHQLPMVWFDQVLRRYGGLLPLPGFAARLDDPLPALLAAMNERMSE